ncbi:hypothetical protein G4W71_12485 [Clostridium botulinum]|uniref:hypothetical protein n=1 Tax=Clostridium botulinum TaxID=1491 RepID=UPI001267C01E|nr:hypothetical protein [Clostridium botulinum]MBE1304819.1 hypothetical protein [Clostridium botulinum]
MLENESIIGARGSFITSQKKLIQRWAWGYKKTRRFLKRSVMQYYIWIKRFKIGNTTFTLKDLK